MASIQTERGRNAAAVETLKKFLRIEPTGVYAQAAKERLGIKGSDIAPVKRGAEMKSPVKLGDIKGDTEKVLKGMKQKKLILGAFSGEIYEGRGIKVLAIDETVEIVERESDKVISIEDFTKTFGEPTRKIRSLYGNTLIYSNFAVDVVDGKVRKSLYFKRETI
jgi:hypothetical protein